jgi:hypothetical protein
VYEYNKNDGVYPLRVSTHTNRAHHVNLLLLTEEDDYYDDSQDGDDNDDDDDDDDDDVILIHESVESFKTHYCLITNLAGLVREKSSDCTKCICPFCLHAFSCANRLSTHRPQCQVHRPRQSIRQKMIHFCFIKI